MPLWLFSNLTDMMTVAILMTVFNRREKTLSCLEACRAQIETFRREEKYSFSVYLTDDGSTDGTAEAVAERFPEVSVIRGSGNLFWNRGMIEAWKAAASADPDFYLWLNDDTIMKDGAIATLLETSTYLGHRDIVAGTVEDSRGNISYGGRTRSGRIVEPDPVIPRACDIFNGNLVLVPSSVYHTLGTMDPCYSHGFGDYDYGLRADKAGIISVVAPGILAVCDRHDGVPVWRDSSRTLSERYRALSGPKGRPVREQFIYDMRLYGVLYAVMHFVTLNLRVIFPQRKRPD